MSTGIGSLFKCFHLGLVWGCIFFWINFTSHFYYVIMIPFFIIITYLLTCTSLFQLRRDLHGYDKYIHAHCHDFVWWWIKKALNWTFTTSQQTEYIHLMLVQHRRLSAKVSPTLCQYNSVCLNTSTEQLCEYIDFMNDPHDIYCIS